MGCNNTKETFILCNEKPNKILVLVNSRKKGDEFSKTRMFLLEHNETIKIKIDRRCINRIYIYNRVAIEENLITTISNINGIKTYKVPA